MVSEIVIHRSKRTLNGAEIDEVIADIGASSDCSRGLQLAGID
jgi:hypothetical protein